MDICVYVQIFVSDLDFCPCGSPNSASESTLCHRSRMLSYIPHIYLIAMHMEKEARPISLLNTLGKVFETTIHTRLMAATERMHTPLINEQFGFRAQHSSVHQVHRITEDTLAGFTTSKSQRGRQLGRYSSMSLRHSTKSGTTA